jgi:hypothetical protein
MAPKDLVIDEVIRLHRFFDAWYEGDDGLTIEEFADAMDPLFTIVAPDGYVVSRAAIISAVEDGFGTGDVSITVENFDVIERDGYSVCRYDEVQTSGKETTTRISTAILEPDARTPGGYRWMSVHETWAHGQAGAGNPTPSRR